MHSNRGNGKKHPGVIPKWVHRSMLNAPYLYSCPLGARFSHDLRFGGLAGSGMSYVSWWYCRNQGCRSAKNLVQPKWWRERGADYKLVMVNATVLHGDCHWPATWIDKDGSTLPNRSAVQIQLVKTHILSWLSDKKRRMCSVTTTSQSCSVSPVKICGVPWVTIQVQEARSNQLAGGYTS